MIAIGRYLVFIISIAGMILSVDISPENKQKFLREIFNIHNEYRLKHNVKLLDYDDNMCEVASYILEYIILKDIAISHNKYGMNISWMPFDDNTKLDTTEAKMIVSKWYEKGNNYNYDNEPPNTKTDPFTRIVWENTTQFGVAMAFKENKYVVLVFYSPPGNKGGEFTKNVIKPQKSPILAGNSSLKIN